MRSRVFRNNAVFAGLTKQKTDARLSLLTPGKPAAAIHTDPWPDRLVVPSQLGVVYNVHVLEAILTSVAPALGWR
jgi:hypothetical protein